MNASQKANDEGRLKMNKYHFAALDMGGQQNARVPFGSNQRGGLVGPQSFGYKHGGQNGLDGEAHPINVHPPQAIVQMRLKMAGECII